MALRKWLCLASLLFACDDRPLVVVSVAPLPKDAGRLTVSLTYRGQPARAPAPIDFDLAGQDLGEPVSFGVHLPARTDGDLVVGAGALDRGGCLRAFGSAVAEPISQVPKLDVPMFLAPDSLAMQERCEQPESTPLLLSVTPRLASSRGGERVVLRGWGFVPDACSLVSINAEPATEVLCTSLVELSATVPSSRGTIGPVPVQVLNRNGRRTVNFGLFSYYAETIRLAAAPMPYAVDAAPIALASGRIDSDLRPDLVVVSRDRGTATVLINDGQGSFVGSPPARVQAGVRPSAVALGDVNRDGAADVLVTSSTDQSLGVLLQGPPAVPVQFQPLAHVFVNLLPSSLALGDANGDGAPDAVVANQLSSDVSLLLNDGRGNLIKSTQRDYSVGREPLAVALADLDRDGDLDLVVRSAASSSLTLLYNQGGAFAASSRHDIKLAAVPTALAVADLDGDQAPEAVAALGNGTAQVLWNDGAGGLDQLPSLSIAVAQNVTALAAADLDLDGHLDVVAATAAEQRIYVLRNTQMRTGQKGLERLPGGYAVGSRPVAVAIADFDGDERPDIAVANQDDSTVTLLFNQSN